MANTAILGTEADEATPSARSLHLRHGLNARTVALERARKLNESGDINGAIKWLRVMENIIAIDESVPRARATNAT